MNKKCKSITVANNWKEKQIKEVIKAKEQMTELKVDPKLIDKYIESEYSRINKEYEEKMKKAKIKNLEFVNNNKKKIEIDFLIKNKDILEQAGYTKDYIDYYVNKQYDIINKKYANVDFVD